MSTKEKQRKDGQPFADSDELFESIYRKELNALRKGKAQKAEHRKTAQASSAQKHKPASNLAAEQPGKPKSGEQKDRHQVFDEKTARGEKPAKASKRPKLGMLLLLLVILGVVFLYYQRGIDMGFLKTIQEPEKETIQRPIPTGSMGKADKKEARTVTPEPSAHITVVTETTGMKPAHSLQSQSKEDQHVTEEEKAKHESKSVKSGLAASAPSREDQPVDNPKRTKVVQDRRRVSYPYSIYLGSYKTDARARKAISLYEQKGLSPYWVKVDLGAKGKWFRVFTGYFQDREAAEAFIRRNKLSEAESKHTKHANLIGIYESEEDIETKKQILTELGYFPYVIKGINGECSLYIGAFYQKSRAEKEQEDLASKGIKSRVVER